MAEHEDLFPFRWAPELEELPSLERTASCISGSDLTRARLCTLLANFWLISIDTFETFSYQVPSDVIFQ